MPHTIQVTMGLRSVLKTDGTVVLQQCWIDTTTGHKEWHDVPRVLQVGENGDETIPAIREESKSPTK